MPRPPSDRSIPPRRLIELLSNKQSGFITKTYSTHNFCTVQFTVPVAPQIPVHRQITAPQLACGKGPTANHAKAAALAEAAERYSLVFQGNETLIHAPFNAFKKIAIPPSAVQQFSKRQYEARGLGHHAPFHFPWIPPKCPAKEPIFWYPAWSATADKTVLLPAQCTFMAGPGQTRYIRADTNGCAAGGTIEEAVLFALLELIERDAIAIWWANRVSRRRVALPNTREAQRLASELKHSGRRLALIDISTDIPVSVTVAVSWCPKTNKRIALAFGAHWDPQRAALRALRELLQVHNNHSHSHQEYERGSMEYAQMLWLRDASLQSDPHLSPTGEPLQVTQERESVSLPTIERLRKLIEMAKEANLDVFIQDLTRPEIGLPVVRVTCPQLCLPWGRFALRRLYQLPVQMGWRSKPLKESELNPIPFAM